MPRGAILLDHIEAEDVHRVSLHFVLKIDNPRPLSAGVTVEGWTLRINGVETRGGAALSGAGGLSFLAEPGLSAEIPLRLDLDLDALARGVLDWKNELNLTTDLALSYGAGSPVRISAGGTAEFPRIMEPVFTITGIAVLKAELINTRFRVSLRIDNPNPFPVELSAFSYELYEGGRFWADGEEKNILHIPAMSQADTRLFLVMNFIGMKRELLDKIIYLRNVRYRFTGKAEVSTGIPFLPRFRTGFDLSGYSEVLE
ncbi:MAG: LEA type 2 family protein [Treponema sp.]|jgi:LEA14-like dessication related protein|nr:LEA type 2 family protein [Treponema sp.]